MDLVIGFLTFTPYRKAMFAEAYLKSVLPFTRFLCLVHPALKSPFLKESSLKILIKTD